MCVCACLEGGLKVGYVLILGPGGKAQALHGSLNLVDLAGSERLDRSGATGDRLKETQVCVCVLCISIYLPICIYLHIYIYLHICILMYRGSRALHRALPADRERRLRAQSAAIPVMNTAYMRHICDMKAWLTASGARRRSASRCQRWARICMYMK